MDFHTALGRMSSYGDRHSSLRRPHESSSTVTAQTLILKIKSIQCENTEDVAIDTCLIIYDTLLKSDSIENILRQLHCACLMDSFFARHVCLFIARAIKRDTDAGNTLRSKWLEILQNNYELRKELSQQSLESFLSVISIHGETYNEFIVATEKIQVLAPPLIEYLEMALKDGSDESMKMLVLQLVINGKSLQLQSNKLFVELQSNIRKSMLTKTTPLHLLAIDIVTEKFFLLDGQIQNFYKTELKDTYRLFESRAKGISYYPDDVGIKKLPENALSRGAINDNYTASNINTNSTSSTVSGIPDVNEVRERMRAKGILPRKSSTPKKLHGSSPEQNDDDFYGLQLPRSKTLDKNTSDLSEAKAAALPKDEWD